MGSLTLSAAAADLTPDPTSPPRVALVLSGGGARGAAHIGVLRVLEELRVPVDLVVGTSIGSIVGGLYATGWSPDDIETLLLHVDWDRIFSDKVERRGLSFRRKQDDYPYLIQTRLRFKGFRPYVPLGVLGGQRLELLLRSIEVFSTGSTEFDILPIRYRAVACDLATGEVVVLSRGSLATAMRASMSVPAAFPPVELDGRTLVDGGSAANFPVGVAQSLGAKHVIGVDISTPLDDKGLSSVFGVYNQLSNFLTVGNRDEDVRRLRPSDVLIVPELGNLRFVDFKRAAEAVRLGEQAARAKADELRRFAVSEEEYAAFLKRQRRESREMPVVDRVTLVNSSPVDDDVVLRQLHVELGAPLDQELLERDLISLYNQGYFGVIRHRVERDRSENRLVLETPAPRHGRASLQFGFSLGNDLRGDSHHAFAVRHRVLAVNRRGGEWQNLFQTGDTMLLGSELYQPLDFDLPWFAAPRVELRQTSMPLWVDGEQTAEYRFERSLVGVEIGRVLGRWGEARIGVVASANDGTTRIGASDLPDVEANLCGVEATFRVDTLDAVVFPTSGVRLDARYQHGLDGLGSDEEYRRAVLAVEGAVTRKRWTVMPGLEIGSNRRSDPSPFDLYHMGGFARLSGLANDELFGAHAALARLVVYRELGRLVVASAKVRVVAGVTLEAGNVFADDSDITFDALRTGGSVFAGVDSSIGPLVLAWGHSEGGRSRFHISFGQSF